MNNSSPSMKVLKLSLLFLMVYLFSAANSLAIGPDVNKIIDTIKSNHTENKKEIKGKIKSKIKEIISGVPQEILKAQSQEKVKLPAINEAIKLAQQAAKEQAATLIDLKFHQNGKTLEVPADFPTINQAIAAAQRGDTVLVAPGIYYEQIVMKDGIRLISAAGDNGNQLTAVDNARIQLPRRTLRTIIDGSKSKTSKHGMFDFNPGVTDKTIIDGFTIRNLPSQNHHIPGHAHGLNIRGASPIIMNCYIKDNGSTGIGSHVVYNDQQSPIQSRDFRWENIKNFASAVIYNNIITGSLGLGIGCNHFSSPYILGNEVFANNDTDLGAKPSPGMGNKHGSHAVIIGNIVHNNPGGGILCQLGEPQGKHGVNRITHPTIIKNVVYDNGPDRPGIAAKNAGSVNRPVIIQSNYVSNPGATGIALSESSAGIIENNMVTNPQDPGIAVNNSSALKLNGNQITNLNGTPGIVIINGGIVHEMTGNAVDADKDAPPYLLDSNSDIKTIN